MSRVWVAAALAAAAAAAAADANALAAATVCAAFLRGDGCGRDRVIGARQQQQDAEGM